MDTPSPLMLSSNAKNVFSYLTASIPDFPTGNSTQHCFHNMKASFPVYFPHDGTIVGACPEGSVPLSCFPTERVVNLGLMSQGTAYFLDTPSDSGIGLERAARMSYNCDANYFHQAPASDQLEIDKNTSITKLSRTISCVPIQLNAPYASSAGNSSIIARSFLEKRISDVTAGKEEFPDTVHDKQAQLPLSISQIENKICRSLSSVSSVKLGEKKCSELGNKRIWKSRLPANQMDPSILATNMSEVTAGFRSAALGKKRKSSDRYIESLDGTCFNLHETKVKSVEDEHKIETCNEMSKTKDHNNNQQNSKSSSKKQEAPKTDFIHVRARRGQATDNHSLAERLRRERISQRMKFLQDLVPGCNKVVGKAVMLDEIINYVQSLQQQVQILSMKLAALSSSSMELGRPDHNVFSTVREVVASQMKNGSPWFGQRQELIAPLRLGTAAVDAQLEVPHSCGGGELRDVVQMGSFDHQLDSTLQSPICVPGQQQHLRPPPGISGYGQYDMPRILRNPMIVFPSADLIHDDVRKLWRQQ